MLYFLCVFGAYSLAAATGRGEAAVRSAERKDDFPNNLEVFIPRNIYEKVILFQRVRPPDNPVEVLRKDDENLPKYIIEINEKISEKLHTDTTSRDEKEYATQKDNYETENEKNELTQC